MAVPCSVVANSEPRSAESHGVFAVRAVQKQTPLWELVGKYHGLGASEDEQAQKAGLRHVFLDVLRTARELSRVPKTSGAIAPERFEAYSRLLRQGVSVEFLESDGNLFLTRNQAAVLFGTGMAKTGKVMSVSRAYLDYLLNDFEECSQRPVAVPL